MASADNCFDILVWNLHCNNCPAADRKAELEVNADAAKNRYKNLILLCTDNVNEDRDILDQRFSPRGVIETNEAEIYYQSTGSYDMNCSGIDVFFNTVPQHTEGRFTASVLRKASKTILVVAWHGWTRRPKEVRERDAKITSVSQDELVKKFKRDTLIALLKFVENIRRTRDYGAVIVGGDFNLDSKVAADVMKREMQHLQGNVLDCYHESKIDYLLFWKEESQELTWKSTARVFKKEDTEFNHPILRYRFSHGT